METGTCGSFVRRFEGRPPYGDGSLTGELNEKCIGLRLWEEFEREEMLL